MSDKEKKDIEVEVLNISKQIDHLSKRKVDLENDHVLSVESIEKKSNSVSSAMIDGKDSGKEIDALVREKTKAEGLSAAIRIAEEQIVDLSRRRAEKEERIYLIEFLECNEELKKILFSLISKLRDAIPELRQAQIAFDKFAAAKEKRNVRHNDETMQTGQIFHGLKKIVIGSDNEGGYNYRLSVMDKEHAEYFKNGE